MTPVAETLDAWHEFALLLGTAAATLIGLLFVAASFGSGIWQRRAAMRVFLSATEVNFATVLAACATTVVPWRQELAAGLCLIAIGSVGLLYSAIAWRDSVRDGLSAHIEWDDLVWYVVVPIGFYLVLAGSGIALALHRSYGCAAMGIALIGLLLTGIHNAWDITVWIVSRPRK